MAVVLLYIIFNQAKISHIVTFDLPEFSFESAYIDFKASKIFDVKPKVTCDPLDSKIFVKEYIERGSRLLSLNFELKLTEVIRKHIHNEIKDDSTVLLRDFIENIDLISNKININVSLGTNGIYSAIFSFELKNPIKLDILIDFVNSSAVFIEDYLYDLLKKELLRIIEYSNNYFIEATDFYTVISTTDSNIDVSKNKKEIFGLLWTNNFYNEYGDEIIKDAIKTLMLYNDVYIIVSIVASLIIMKNGKVTNNPNNYIYTRLKIIELHQRQKYLLKKLDIQLDNFILNIKKDKNIDKNIDENLKKIKDTHIDMESKLEVYRNVRVFSKATLIILFDLLNDVFLLKNRYNYVNEKMNACNLIYQRLDDTRRNQFMERLQSIILIFGLLSLILVTVQTLDSENYINRIFYIINSLLIIIIIILIYSVFSKLIKNIKK